MHIYSCIVPPTGHGPVSLMPSTSAGLLNKGIARKRLQMGLEENGSEIGELQKGF